MNSLKDKPFDTIGNDTVNRESVESLSLTHQDGKYRQSVLFKR